MNATLQEEEHKVRISIQYLRHVKTIKYVPIIVLQVEHLWRARKAVFCTVENGARNVRVVEIVAEFKNINDLWKRDLARLKFGMQSERS